MCRLVRLYASNFLCHDAILHAGDDLSQLCLNRDNQVDDDNLGIGTNTWACLAELEGEMDTKHFFTAERSSYLASLKKMLKKFPFSDSLLKDLGSTSA